MVYLSNKAQYTWLRTVLRHDTTHSAWIQPLAVVYWPYTTPLVCYSYYRLVTNKI